MLFNSFSYMLFLPIVLLVYWLLPHRFRWILILFSSYYFYISWNAKYVVLIFFTTLSSYVTALVIERIKKRELKIIILWFSLCFCLGVLFFFKYFNFFSISLFTILKKFSIGKNPIIVNVLLPVGISFYTFQTLSYVIDVYKGNIEAEKHFGIYAAFVSFFPQLVAGPIERAENLLPQIKGRHQFDYDKATYGLKLMAWGYFKKLCVADVLAIYVDMVYSSLHEYTGIDLLYAMLFFSIQIYCDFSGYSDIAIGSAKLLGIDLMTNFRSPYFAISIKDFWSKWHISLSTWFRDYVYIPLGGNRCGNIRHIFNLIITFLISGLWHGANWTFMIWGGIHGTAQVLENYANGMITAVRNNRLGKFISIIGVFIFGNIAWVFFRAASIHDALYVLVNMLDGIWEGSHYFVNNIGLTKEKGLAIFCSIGVLSLFDFFSLKTDVILWLSRRNFVIRWMVYIALVVYIAFEAQIGNSSFIYFQF